MSNLPTIEWEGRKLAVDGGRFVKVWYPVFPTDKSADEGLK